MATADPGHPRTLACVRRAWPWGLVVFSDPADAGMLPAHFDANGIACTHGTLVAPILHEVDGEATAEIRDGPAPSGLVCLHDGFLAVSSGTVDLTDAARIEVQSARLAPGRYRARVFVDSRSHAETVVLHLELLR